MQEAFYHAPNFETFGHRRKYCSPYIMGYEMCLTGNNFHAGDGILADSVENTIKNVGRLGRVGMRDTDREIMKIMTGN